MQMDERRRNAEVRMMRDSTKDLIESYKARIIVMEQEGNNQIESRRISDLTPSAWFDETHSMWNFDKFEYRIKIKPVEGWAWKYTNNTLEAVAHLYNQKQQDDVYKSDRVMVLMREVTK